MSSRLPATWEEKMALWKAAHIAAAVASSVLKDEPTSLNPDEVEFVPRREPLPPQQQPQQQHQQLVQKLQQLLQHLLQQRQQQQLLLLQQLLLQQKQQQQ